MNKSVCFTGHRTIAEDKETLSARLYALLERLVTEQKVTDFYTGGAVGWDALAALTVLKLRESYPEVKLHLVLPCPFEDSLRSGMKHRKRNISISSVLQTAWNKSLIAIITAV